MGAKFHFATCYPLIPSDDQLRLRLAEGVDRARTMIDPATAPIASREARSRFAPRLMD